MRVALVTGGVKGIGKAISLKLSQEGFFVVANYASSDKDAQALVEELGVDRCDTVKFDVGNYNEVIENIKNLETRFGSVDVLVNNAGITRDDLLIRLKETDIRRVIEVNLLGAIFCSQAVLKGMLKKRWGRIVNISSIVGEMGNAGQIPYSASKAGLIGLTKSLAKEVGSRNITVNCVTPGYIETDMTRVLPDTVKEAMLKNIPVGRFGSANDVAQIVSFLVSDQADYINGAIIPVNGGML
ncbi:MAG: 3-oxoacyl-[acyl-carrier-protein] reductase [Deltaproteobacteria bacterium]|nr:3-oxoacyl-[acyl-carrier-protein] reductase [Deltaproteobacteria bacterium]